MRRFFARLEQAQVRRHPITGFDEHDVAGYDIRGSYRRSMTVADDARLRVDHAANGFQRVFSTPLLEVTDGRVDDNNSENHRRVRPVAKQRRHRAGRDQHVDQDVVELADYPLEQRPPRRRRQRVRSMLREPPPRLRAVKPARRRSPAPAERRPASRACQSSEAPGSALIGQSLPRRTTVARSD